MPFGPIITKRVKNLNWQVGILQIQFFFLKDDIHNLVKHFIVIIQSYCMQKMHQLPYR